MYKRLTIFFTICILSSWLCACAAPTALSEQEQAFLAMFPEGTFDRKGYVKLMTILPEGKTGIFIGKSVAILVKNVSRQTIEFPYDFDYRMFYFENFQWKEVTETTEFVNLSDKEETILYPEEDWESGHFSSYPTLIRPTIENNGKPVTIRWVAIGEILEDGKLSGKKVGCYIDVVFEPEYQTPAGTTEYIIVETPGVITVIPGNEWTPPARTPTLTPSP